MEPSLLPQCSQHSLAATRAATANCNLRKLNDLYLQLMGSDRVAAESAAGFDGLEAANDVSSPFGVIIRKFGR